MDTSRSTEPRPYLMRQEQTYLARIRYGTQLAEPLCPPKLLAMPVDDLPLFCSTSSMPLRVLTEDMSVDVDAECGMPLDATLGPGVYNGTDKIIPALSHLNVHPTDRLLLRTTDLLRKNNPLSSLGRKASSFLRRTEYISTDGPQYVHVSASARTQRLAMAKLATIRAHGEGYQEPTRILQAVLRGFDTANPSAPRQTPDLEEEEEDEFAAQAERRWTPLESMKHPDRPGLMAVDEFPLLPDLEACSDSGGFMVFSFQTAPIPPAPRRDPRLDLGILIPHDQPTEGGTEQTFDYYLPSTQRAARDAKCSFSDYRSDSGYTPCPVDDNHTFPYTYLRTYETRVQRQATDTFAVVLHGGDAKKAKAAYYSPVDAKFVLQPARGGKMLGRSGPVERLNVSVRELYDEELARRQEVKRVRMGL